MFKSHCLLHLTPIRMFGDKLDWKRQAPYQICVCAFFYLAQALIILLFGCLAAALACSFLCLPMPPGPVCSRPTRNAVWCARANTTRNLSSRRHAQTYTRESSLLTSGRVVVDVITSIGMRASMFHHHQRITIPT